MCTRCPESFSNLAAKTDISLRKAAIYDRLIVLVIKHQKRGGNEKNLGEFKIITD